MQLFRKTSWQILKSLKIERPYAPVIPPLGSSPGGMKTHVPAKLLDKCLLQHGSDIGKGGNNCCWELWERHRDQGLPSLLLYGLCSYAALMASDLSSRYSRTSHLTLQEPLDTNFLNSLTLEVKGSRPRSK